MEIKRRAALSLPSFPLPWLKIARTQSAINPKPPRLNIRSHQSTTTTWKPYYNCKEDSLQYAWVVQIVLFCILNKLSFRQEQVWLHDPGLKSYLYHISDLDDMRGP